MQSHSTIAVKPLVAALALALGAAGSGAQADTPSNSAFQARLQAFGTAVAQAQQKYSQHPPKFPLFGAASGHTVKFPKHRSQRPAAPAATIAVTSCVDNASSATTAGTLRYAVINAVNGDTIDLSACNNSTITLTQGALPVTIDDLSITAGSGNHVTIDGNATDRVISATGTGTGTTNVLALSYLTIRNGKAPIATIGTSTYPVAAGGCIFAYRDGVGLYNTIVTGCQAVNPNGVAEGGGIAATGLYLQSSSITNNLASAGKTGTGTNKYGAIGGGAISGTVAYAYNSHIDGNVATGSGGVNSVAGGGLFALAVHLENSTISSNSIRLDAGSTSGKYIAFGGGLVSATGGQMSTSTISGNRATCTNSSAPTTPNNFCLAGGVLNLGLPIGGGTNPSPGTLYVGYSTISGNHSDFLGGGVSSKYNLALAQSTVSGNSAMGGAGIVLSASKYGGGTVVGAATIYNSTIAANQATYSGSGGGIFDAQLSAATPVSITLVSSIVAKNTGAGVPDDIYLAGSGPLTVGGTNSLVMATGSNTTLPAGTLNADPLLAPLANNGGPTWTMGLLAGSPAIDAGSNPSNFANDQRGSGFPRVVGAAVDIGAFEGTVVLAPPVPAPALSIWALGMLAGLLALFGWRRRRSG